MQSLNVDIYTVVVPRVKPDAMGDNIRNEAVEIEEEEDGASCKISQLLKIWHLMVFRLTKGH